MIVTTANSTFYLDTQAKTWKRVDATEHSGELRTNEGEYLEIANLREGERMVLLCPPLSPTANMRMIATSEVVEITETPS